MPELPDVETMRRYLERTSLRRRVAEVERVDGYVTRGTRARELHEALRGARLASTARIGKNLLVRLADGAARPWLALHFGMTGRLLRLEAGEVPPAETRLLLRFAGAGGGALALVDRRRLGRVALADSPGGFADSRRLGPDALDPALTEEAFLRLLERRRGRVKAALMDQSLVAGIGNVYSDEILFQARIAPLERLARMSAPRRRRLYRALREVLRAAVEAEGDPARMPEGWLLRRRREGEPCPGRCAGTVERVKLGGRSAYWCPRCQKAG
ncbi:MAG: Fpg/Nei family DNA glycosylase [Coriobacteriia bacterium]|nr:Fpg/Nei family DNA glycosylase [Coriobacteriia bacterium]